MKMQTEQNKWWNSEHRKHRNNQETKRTGRVILNTENKGVAKKHRTMGVANSHNQDSCSPMMIPSIQVKKKVMYCHLPLSPARDSRSF